MKSKLFRIAITLITLTAIASFGIYMYNLTKSSKTDKRNGAISLEAPFFASVAEASEATDAFPKEEAGIAAYVNTGRTIDIEKIKTIFTEVEKVGDNHIIGITPIPDFGGAINVHLYADTDGWLVAYLKAGEPAAKMMQWGEASVGNPKIGVIKSTTLVDALYKGADAANIGLTGDIKYYDFEFPDANSMTLFIITRANDGANTAQVEVPTNYTLYEASYYHYTYDANDSKLKVDGATVSDAPDVGNNNWWSTFSLYKGTITIGELHKIEISYSPDTWVARHNYDSGSAGVATVLIYKAE